MRFILCCSLLFVAAMAAAEDFTLQAEATLSGGTPVDISISPTPEVAHFLTLVAADTAEGKYGDYQYVLNKSRVTLQTPVQPGEYELRLLENVSGYPTLSRRALTITPAEVSLTAPEQAQAGAPVSIAWEGPAGQGDYITVVAVGTPDEEYGRYAYTSRNPVSLIMPDTPGEYELRYLTHRNEKLASRPIVVEGFEVQMSAPRQVAAGASVSIEWSGVQNSGDFITIVAPGTAERKYDEYVYAKSSPATMAAPETPGEYEIRYLSANEYRTLASAPLTVGGVDASVSAPVSAVAGARIEIAWSGPDNRGDYLTLVPAGTPDGQYDRYVYTSKGTPVRFDTPAAPGEYEIRYQTARNDIVLARQPVTLTDPSASLSGPETVETREVFPVLWEGDGNPLDYIAITEAGNPRRYFHYAYVQRGNPVSLQAPTDEGEYELHYLTEADQSLAVQPITVVASKAPGSLRVVSTNPARASVGSDVAVEVILDASGSMLQRLDGNRRIDIARRAVTDLISDALAPGVPFAFRAFGHRQPDACDTELMIPLSPLNPASARATVAAMEAKNLAKTPIADSLAQVPNDLAGIEGEVVVVLVTDGEETCEGDPRKVIETLRSSGYDIRVNIVGFAIDEAALKQEFAAWANAGGGSYYDAADAGQLGNGIRNALRLPYTVLDVEGGQIATGVVGGEPILLGSGRYSVVVNGAAFDVAVEADSESVLELP